MRVAEIEGGSHLGREAAMIGAVLRVGAVIGLILAQGGVARAAPPDPWWGPDKALHLTVSMAAAGGGYGLAALVTESRGARFGFGLGGALALGVGKELYDLAGPGQASGKDLLFDGLGAVVGALVGLGLDWALSEAAARQDPPDPLSGARGAGADALAPLHVGGDPLQLLGPGGVRGAGEGLGDPGLVLRALYEGLHQDRHHRRP